MDMLPMLAAAGAFLAAETAKKVGGMAVEKAFAAVTGLFQKSFGRAPMPEDFDPAALRKTRLDADPVFVEQARAVVSRSTALRRAAMVRRALEGAAVLWVDDVPANNVYE